MTTQHSRTMLLALLTAWLSACDRATDPAAIAPQYHEDAKHVDCDDSEVDCVADLDQPATYERRSRARDHSRYRVFSKKERRHHETPPLFFVSSVPLENPGGLREAAQA